MPTPVLLPALVAVLVAALVALAPARAAAQPTGVPTGRPEGDFGVVEDRQSNVPSYYFHVLPGEATKSVYVWGTVRAPGLYVVAVGTDLGEVLALAGGPLVGPLPDNTTREVTVRVYHVEDGPAGSVTRALAYERPLADVVREPAAWPALRSTDVVEVETRETRGRELRDTFAIIGSAGALAAVVLQIIYLATR